MFNVTVRSFAWIVLSFTVRSISKTSNNKLLFDLFTQSFYMIKRFSWHSYIHHQTIFSNTIASSMLSSPKFSLWLSPSHVTINMYTRLLKVKLVKLGTSIINLYKMGVNMAHESPFLHEPFIMILWNLTCVLAGHHYDLQNMPRVIKCMHGFTTTIHAV